VEEAWFDCDNVTESETPGYGGDKGENGDEGEPQVGVRLDETCWLY
jgi:hypothetical protein